MCAYRDDAALADEADDGVVGARAAGSRVDDDEDLLVLEERERLRAEHDVDVDLAEDLLQRVEREAGEQKDLIADSLKREADLLFKNGEGGDEAREKISRLYDRALRDYGGSITGFKQMAENYFAYMKDDPITARKAARDIELAFQRVVETGSKDWFRANTETSIYKMICSYYRTAGDEKKAEKLETRYERLLRAAERGAL